MLMCYLVAVDVNDIFVQLHKRLARGIGEVCKSSEQWYKVIIKVTSYEVFDLFI